jgi:hypothetical protein
MRRKCNGVGRTICEAHRVGVVADAIAGVLTDVRRVSILIEPLGVLNDPSSG